MGEYDSGSLNDSYFEYNGQYDNYLVFANAVFAVEVLLAVIGVIANCIVCGVLLRQKRLLKNFSNFHLFNLGIADIIFRLALTPMLLTIQYVAVERGSDALCKLGGFGTYTTLAVTFTLLLGIAFDRYVHIVHPLKARCITWKHSRNAVIISWFYGAFCSSPFLYSMKYIKAGWNLTDDAEYELCLSMSGVPWQISSSIFLVFAFLLPLVLMAVAYSEVLKVLWQRSRSKVINSKIAEAKLRAVKMMMVIVVAYFISWGPKLIWICLQAFEVVSLEYLIDWESEETSWEDNIKEEKKYIMLYIIDDIIDLFTFTSSVLNPVIFGYYNISFREDLKKCCICSKCCRKSRRKVGAEKQNLCVLDLRTKTTENVLLDEKIKTAKSDFVLDDRAPISVEEVVTKL